MKRFTKGLCITFLAACIFQLETAFAHVSLTFPPARKLDLDFLDYVRTKMPCGMPKGKFRTVLKAGTAVNVTWHLAFPHTGGYRLELLDKDENFVAKLSDPASNDTHVMGDITAQWHTVQIPDQPCEDCTLRLLRQATEWKEYGFWSCADISIVKPGKHKEDCLGRGKVNSNSVCKCDKGYWGPRCSYKDECENNSDCGKGVCIDIAGTTLPRKQCFCEAGFHGDRCQVQNKATLPTPKTLKLSSHKKTSLSDDMTLYHKIVDDSVADDDKEIEFVLIVNGTSYGGVGWRPASIDRSCMFMPVIDDYVTNTLSRNIRAANRGRPQKSNPTLLEPLHMPEKIMAEPESAMSNKRSTKDKHAKKPHSKPEPSAEPEHEPVPEPETEPEPESGRKKHEGHNSSKIKKNPVHPKPESEPSAEPEKIVQESKPESEPEASSEPKSEPKATNEPEPEASSEPKSEPKPSSEPKSEPKPSSEPNSEPEASTEPKSEPEASSEPETEPEVSSEPKSEPKSSSEPKSEQKPSSEPKSEPETSSEPKAEPEAESEPSAEPETACEPKAEPKISPTKRTKSKRTPNPDPTPEVDPRKPSTSVRRSLSVMDPKMGTDELMSATTFAESVSSMDSTVFDYDSPFKLENKETAYSPRHPLMPMGCSDIVIGTARGMYSRIRDYYTRDMSSPRFDTLYGGTEDLTSATGWEQNGMTTIIFRRKLKTGDPTDHDLSGSMRVIWAKGQQVSEKPNIPDFFTHDELKYHGHGKQRGIAFITFP